MNTYNFICPTCGARLSAEEGTASKVCDFCKQKILIKLSQDDTVALTCDGCGASLRINKSFQTVNCPKCGKTISINSGGNTQSSNTDHIQRTPEIKDTIGMNIEDVVKMYLHAGNAYIKCNAFKSAEHEFEKALFFEKNNFHALLGLLTAQTENFTVCEDKEIYNNFKLLSSCAKTPEQTREANEKLAMIVRLMANGGSSKSKNKEEPKKVVKQVPKEEPKQEIFEEVQTPFGIVRKKVTNSSSGNGSAIPLTTNQELEFVVEDSVLVKYKGSLKVKVLVMPDTFKAIDKNVFKGLVAEEVHLPNSLTTIGESSFKDAKIDKLYMFDELKTIGENAFFNASIGLIRFGKGLKTISEGAFMRCKIIDIELPSSLVTIGKRAFFTSTIQKLDLKNGLECIDNEAFAQCDSLNDLYIPTSVKQVGASVFSGFNKNQTIFVYKKQMKNWNKLWKKGCKAEVVVTD